MAEDKHPEHADLESEAIRDEAIAPGASASETRAPENLPGATSAGRGTDVAPELLGDVYTVLAARRTAYDTLMWQVPALGLTAQAFLLTIALGGGFSRWARLIAATLAFFTALVAMQTMAKHRANERTDSLMLEALERKFGVSIGGKYPHENPSVRADTGNGNPLFDKWYNKRKSFRLWIAGLTLFALASFVVGILTAFRPSLLQGGP